MPRQKIPKAYTDFKSYLRVRSFLVRCPWLGCDEKMLPKRYQEHCKTRHDLDVMVYCAFCRGKATWERKQKTQMGKHLHACAKRFVRLYETNELESPRELGNLPDSSLLDDESIIPTLQLSNESAFSSDDSLFCSNRCFEFRSCEKRKSFRTQWNDHDWNVAGVRWMEERLFESNPERLDFDEEDVIERMGLAKPDEKEMWLALLNPLQFDGRSGLGQAHLWIKRYLYSSWTENHYTWYHLCVRAGCMESFVEAMEGIDIVAAPYWCVCDGGFGFDRPMLQARTHHRHLIVAVRNRAQFQKVMEKKIEYRASGEAPEPGFKKYYSKLFNDANHFANSLAYVSLPSSKCRCKQYFQIGVQEKLNVPENENRLERHYFIANNMLSHARWWMQLLIPCGGIDRLARFSIGPRSVYGMKSRGKVEGKWMLSAAEEFRVKNCVVRFEPKNLQIDGRHPIENLKEYIESPFEIAFGGQPYPKSGNPFVYWFDGKKYPVRWMNERPPAFADDESFQEWHVTRRINTLLNLGESNSLFQMSRNMARHANDLDRQKQDYEKEINDKLGAMQRLFDEKEQGLRNEIEKETKRHENCKTEYDVVKERFKAMDRDLKVCRGDKQRMEKKKECTECSSLQSKVKTLQTNVKILQQIIRRQK